MRAAPREEVSEGASHTWVRHPEVGCPIETTLRLIGGKWKPVLLDRLSAGGMMRYSKLARAVPAISPQVLAGCLRSLERDALIHRTVYAEVPPRTEYRLTETGESLIPILRAMSDWGAAYGSPDREAPVASLPAASLPH